LEICVVLRGESQREREFKGKGRKQIFSLKENGSGMGSKTKDRTGRRRRDGARLTVITSTSTISNISARGDIGLAAAG
jgi:hypothetical protein